MNDTLDDSKALEDDFNNNTRPFIQQNKNFFIDRPINLNSTSIKNISVIDDSVIQAVLLKLPHVSNLDLNIPQDYVASYKKHKNNIGRICGNANLLTLALRDKEKSQEIIEFLKSNKHSPKLNLIFNDAMYKVEGAHKIKTKREQLSKTDQKNVIQHQQHNMDNFYSITHWLPGKELFIAIKKFIFRAIKKFINNCIKMFKSNDNEIQEENPKKCGNKEVLLVMTNERAGGVYDERFQDRLKGERLQHEAQQNKTNSMMK